MSADEPHLHAAAGGRELHAIRQEVADDLLQTGGVALDGPDGAVDDACEADSAQIGRRAHRVGGALDEPGEIDRSRLQRELAVHDAADVQEVVDQAALVPRVALDDVEGALGGGLVHHQAGAQHLDPPQYGGERRSQLVGQRREKHVLRAAGLLLVVEQHRALALELAAAADVAEDEHDPQQRAVRGQDRRRAVVDGNLTTVLRDQDGVVREPRDLPVLEDRVGGVRDRPPRLLVDDHEDVRQRAAARVVLAPSGQRLGHPVHQLHAAVLVGGDDGITDARQGDSQPCLRFGEDRREGLGRGPRGVLALARQDGAIQQEPRRHEQPEGDGEAAEGRGRRQPGVARGDGAALDEEPGLLRSHLVDDAADLIHDVLALAGRHDLSRRREAGALPRHDRVAQLVELAPDQALQRDDARVLVRHLASQPAEPFELAADRGLRRVIGRQVVSIAGDDEAPLPGLGVLQEREKGFRLLAQHQGAIHRLDRLAKIRHALDRDRSEDEHDARQSERTDPQPSRRPRSHGPSPVKVAGVSTEMSWAVHRDWASTPSSRVFSSRVRVGVAVPGCTAASERDATAGLLDMGSARCFHLATVGPAALGRRKPWRTRKARRSGIVEHFSG